MTIQDLEQFRGMKNDCDMIKAEIEAFYDTRKSPNTGTDAGHGSTPGNPTEQAVMNKVLPNQELLQRMHKEMTRKLEQIDSWLATVDDAQLRALIRCYYILGNTWKRTSVMIYGYPCASRASQRVHRYFKNDEKSLSV